jgi:peptidyl-prolyl cis-trans isomerase B (cyclophilin B)
MRPGRERTLRPWLASGLVALSLAIAACGDDGEEDTEAASDSGCEQVEAPAPKQVQLKPPKQQVDRGAKLTASVETNCGTFEIALHARTSPKTVSSFVHMAEEGLYDDTTFHRVVPDFVIQGGDPAGTGSGGPGYTVTERPPADTVYARGTVAMAKTQFEPRGASGSQFFVVTAPADAGLPPDYAVLGEVSSGEDVVERIAALADPALGADGGPPSQPVVIEGVTVSK